jgi:transglutaminase-like putative cysteine protease
LNRFWIKVTTAIFFLLAVNTGWCKDNHDSTERIAPALTKLTRSFKPDEKSEATVLLRKSVIRIQQDGFSKLTSYVAVHINSDEAARDYSQISVSFNSFYENIALDFARVRTSDGKIHSIQQDASQIQSSADENFYHDQKELLFSLPNVRKGSVIEFQYTNTETKKIMPGAWFDSFSFNWWEDRAAGQGSRADKVLQSELDIQSPDTKPLYFNDTSKFAVKFSQSQKNNSRIYKWQVKNLAAVHLQEYMQRDYGYAAYVRAGTEKNWSSIANWADQLISPHLKMDPKMQALVNQINLTAKTPEDKVKAVYRLMQDKIRYVFAHVGRGGYEPHDAAEVLKNGYGDCKDQTVFAVTMLRALGIDANPVLIATRSRGIPEMSVPAVTFDHMIVQVPAQNGLKEIWMDTTGDANLYPGFSVGIEDQPALIVKAQNNEISILPSLPAKDHNVDFHLSFDKISGRNIEAGFEIHFSGMYEQRLRSMWQYTPDREKYFHDFIKNLYSSAEVIQLQAGNADSLWEGFYLKGRIRFSNVWAGEQKPMEYGFNITQLINMFADLRNLDKPENRKQSFVLSPGYSINSTITFTPPNKNYKLQLKTQGQNSENAYFSLHQSGETVNNAFRVKQELVMKPVDVSLKNYADYYQYIQDLLNTQDWGLSYVFNSFDAELAAVKQSGKTTQQQQLSLVRLHIKNGQYSEALKIAEAAVIAAPASGEAYYLLGLAQGYNDLLTESDKSFYKAELMGYSP